MTISPFRWLKFRLSHLHRDSWHWRLVRFAFGKKANKFDKKSCPYEWFIVPSSLPVAGIKGIGWLILGAIFLVLLVVIATLVRAIIWGAAKVVGWLFGKKLTTPFLPCVWFFYPRPRDKAGWEPFKFAPYGWKDRSVIATLGRVVPWRIILPVLVVAILTLVAVSDEVASAMDSIWNIRYWMVYGFGAVGSLIGMGLFFRHVVQPWLRRNCPPIEWVDDVTLRIGTGMMN